MFFKFHEKNQNNEETEYVYQNDLSGIKDSGEKKQKFAKSKQSV